MRFKVLAVYTIALASISVALVHAQEFVRSTPQPAADLRQRFSDVPAKPQDSTALKWKTNDTQASQYPLSGRLQQIRKTVNSEFDKPSATSPAEISNPYFKNSPPKLAQPTIRNDEFNPSRVPEAPQAFPMDEAKNALPLRAWASQPPQPLIVAPTGFDSSDDSQSVLTKSNSNRETDDSPRTAKRSSSPTSASRDTLRPFSGKSSSGQKSSRRPYRVPTTTVAPRPTPPPITKQPVPTNTYEPAPQQTFEPVAKSSNETVTRSQGPMIRVETLGPKAIVIGRETEFVVSAINQSEHDASELHIRLSLPAWVDAASVLADNGTAQTQTDGRGVERLVWTIDKLNGRSESQLTLKLVARENQPFDLGVDWALMPITSSAQIEVQQPRLELALSGPKDVLYGETRKYVITVSNPGTGDAENVSVKLSTGGAGTNTRNVGTVPAGRQSRIDIELTAEEAGILEFIALATDDTGLTAEISEEIRVRRANLEIETYAPPLKYAGTAGVFHVRIKNSGDASAENVEAAVALPKGAKLLASSDGKSTESGRVNWRLGSLAPGAERTMQVQCMLMNAGDNRLETRVAADGNISNSAVAVTRVEAIADLKLALNDPQGPKPVGEDVVYEIVVTNRGTKAADDVKVVGFFSNGIEPVRVEGGRAEIVPGQVVFSPIPSLAAGRTLKLKITARATTAANHRFRAELECAVPETKLAAEDSTRYYSLDDPRVGKEPSPSPSFPTP